MRLQSVRKLEKKSIKKSIHTEDGLKETTVCAIWEMPKQELQNTL